MSLRGCAAIVGLGELAPVLNPKGLTTLGMAARVTSEALKDAGLSITDVDGVLAAPDTIEDPLMWGGLVAEYLGIKANYVDIVDLGVLPLLPWSGGRQQQSMQGCVIRCSV